MKHHRRMDSRTLAGRFALLVAAIALLMAAVFLGGKWLQKRSEQPEQRGDYRQRLMYDELIEIDGATYRPRRRLTTLLLMGIDRESDNAGISTYRNGGQADFLRLVVIDSANKRVSQIQIDRDTMTPITILGILGDRSGKRTAQICLAHGFGDGRVQSCELAVEAVSNLFLDIPIDYYIAVNMDGIPVLNDAVGGVTVTIEDDFTALDPAMAPGATLTLQGAQAEIFVRGRRSIGSGLNVDRMGRQQQYLSALAQALLARQEADSDFLGKLYDALLPYSVTNLSKGRLVNEIWLASEYEQAEPLSPRGEHEVSSSGFMEFHADEASIQEIVLSLFYEKVA